MIAGYWGCAMREGQEPPDFVFRWLVVIILAELAVLSIGRDFPQVGGEMAIFVGP
jgi:hypothetical protein